MCGITGAFLAQNRLKKILDGKAQNPDVLDIGWTLYQNQANRGTQGYGLTIADDRGETRVLRSTETASAAVDVKLWPLLEREAGRTGIAQGIMLHHRWPTSTKNVAKATHPFFVRHGKVRLYVCHNGIITNDDEIKAIHEKQGIAYQSQLSGGKFNDSEACAWELAKVLADPKGKQTMRTLGSQAIAALEIDADGKALAVYLTTNGGNPLGYILNDGLFAFASELDIEGMTEIGKNELVRFDLASGVLTTEAIRFAEPKPMEHTPYKYPQTETQWRKQIAIPYEKPIRGFTADEPDILMQELDVDADESRDAIEEYIESLSDKENIFLADLDGTLIIIRKNLEAIREKANKEYELTDKKYGI